jgi:hypothetical protein
MHCLKGELVERERVHVPEEREREILFRALECASK